jgi:tetratricopeptide (TPR) repeat protein
MGRLLTGRALNYARRAEELFNEQDNKISYARALVRTGWILSDQGDLDAAEVKYHQALNILPHAGYDWEVSRAQRSLGSIALRRGDFRSAREHIEISRTLSLDFAP